MESVNNYTEPRYIDYRKLTTALDHYEERGYEYMEVRRHDIYLRYGRCPTAPRHGHK